jgi:hypothetical protein
MKWNYLNNKINVPNILEEFKKEWQKELNRILKNAIEEIPIDLSETRNIYNYPIKIIKYTVAGNL